jgi:hypothetical protein
MIETDTQFLEVIQDIANVVSAVFDSLNEWELIHIPYFSLLDLFVGGGFVGITMNFINRVRAPKVTNG